MQAQPEDENRRRPYGPGHWKLVLPAVLLLLAIPKAVPALSALLTQETETEEGAAVVETVVIQSESLDETLRSSGTLLANREVELSTESSGLVTLVAIDEGQQVQAGKILVQINDNDLRAELEGVEYELEVVQDAAARQERLVAEGGTTRDALDQTLIRLSELRANRAQLEAQLLRREVRAPFDGVLGLAHVDQGAYVTPGSPIATLQAIDSVRVDFSLPERYGLLVEAGDAVRFRVQGVDSTFHGEIRAIEPRVEPQTRALRVRAAAANPDGLLRPGAYADVEVVLDSVPDAIRIPGIALQPGVDGATVFVVRDGHAHVQHVFPGARDREFVQVEEGLAEGDTVIVGGFHRLRDGAPVTTRRDPDGDPEG
jgi:membrane fusion protein, multidrug efflux system